MMITTKRLFIRPFISEDIADVYELRSDADLMKFIREPQSYNEAEAWISMISGKWKTEKIGFAGLFDRTTKEFIGWCGLWLLPETNEIEVGYAIAKKHWRKGFASEAASAFLYYGLIELKLEKIVAVARPENKGSIAVMEKIGMSFIKYGNFYGRDLVQYGISKEQYDRNRTLVNA
jgi:RimJ/RimL family protein N-acetyltransferase